MATYMQINPQTYNKQQQNILKACKKWQLSENTDIRISYLNAIPMIRISSATDNLECRPAYISSTSNISEDENKNTSVRYIQETLFLSSENLDYLTSNWNRMVKSLQSNKDLEISLYSSEESFDKIYIKAKMYVKNSLIHIVVLNKDNNEIEKVTLNLNDVNLFSKYLPEICSYIDSLTRDQKAFNLLLDNIANTVYNMIKQKVRTFDFSNPDVLDLYFNAANEIGCFHYYINIVENVKEILSKNESTTDVNIYFLYFNAIAQHNAIISRLTHSCYEVKQ